jgi:hypothetical protein
MNHVRVLYQHWAAGEETEQDGRVAALHLAVRVRYSYSSSDHGVASKRSWVRHLYLTSDSGIVLQVALSYLLAIFQRHLLPIVSKPHASSHQWRGGVALR